MKQTPVVTVSVLGPLQSHIDGKPAALEGPMQHKLLALLVASRGQTVATASLADQLWSPDATPRDPNRSLRNIVARVRGALGPDSVVTVDQPRGYSLGPTVEVDADRFEELVDAGRRAKGSLGAVTIWAEAVEMWRGQRAFDGYEDLSSVVAPAARLDELRAEALEEWLHARMAAGEKGELAGEMAKAVAEHPFREGLRAQQMTLLNDLGRQPEALRSFQQFRTELADIGLEPSAYLTGLDAGIAAGIEQESRQVRTLRGYRISGELGRGAFSIVYRATQPVIERDVAIKQIRAELANKAEFIAQFEAEAQLVAKLEHPNVVPLYDYWREPGAAYLVMRYLRLGTLADRIRQDPPPLDWVVDCAMEIGAALDEAHRLGIVHRDVKPANILLDEQGRTYLSDFGIAVKEAQAADPSLWLSHGSPVYASPEQLRREPIDGRTDVHGLGITLYEALVGQVPFPNEASVEALLDRQLQDPLPSARSLRPELPAAVDLVLQKATAKDPTDRYASCGELAVDLATAAGRHDRQVQPEDRNPYKGLRAFTEADARDFVGRERLIDTLVEQVADKRMTMIVGPSGAGKSSVVAAGLVPALRAGRLSGPRWFVASMTPGDDPFGALEQALASVAVSPQTGVGARLEADPAGVRSVFEPLLLEGGRLLLVIDQFEELFTLTPRRLRQRFVQVLLATVNHPDLPVSIVATLRADFYHEPLKSPALAEAIAGATVAVHPLAPDELERAIAEPARGVGATFAPGLVARLTAEVADQPGALPLLQDLLAELFERRVDNQLTNEAHRQLGGLSGSLSRRADTIIDVMNQTDRATARQVFGRLVKVNPDGSSTGRRVSRSRLGDAPGLDEVLGQLGDARLLAFDHDPASREPVVTLAHESLLLGWDQLQQWLLEDRDHLRVQGLLAEATQAWDDQGRDDADLYRGARLVAALDTEASGTAPLTEPERTFLQASQDVENAEREAEARTNQRLARLVDRQSVDNRRLRRAATAIAVVAAVAVVAGLLAFNERNRASEEQRAAEVAGLVAESLRLVDDDPELAGLLAVHVYRHDPVAAAPALFASLAASPGLTRSVSWDPVGADRACGSIGQGQAAVASESTAGPIQLLSLGGELETIGEGVVCRAAIDPLGRYIAGVSTGAELRLWNIETGDLMASRQLSPGISGLEWRPDGEALVVLHGRDFAGFEQGNDLDVFAIPSLDRLWPVGTFVDRPTVVAWSEDSSTLLVGSAAGGPEPPLLSLLDATTGTARTSLELRAEPIAVSLSSDERISAVVEATGTILVVETSTGTVSADLSADRFESRPTRAWLAGEGRWLVVALLNGSVVVLDSETGVPIAPSVPTSGGVVTLQTVVSEDGVDRLVILTTDGTLQEIVVGQSGPSSTSVALPPRQLGLEPTVRGRKLVSRHRLLYSIGPNTGGRVFLVGSQEDVSILDLTATASLRGWPLSGSWWASTWGLVGLPDGDVGAIVSGDAYASYNSSGQTLSTVRLSGELSTALFLFDIHANASGTVALLGRQQDPEDPRAHSVLPLDGLHHLFLGDGLTGEFTRLPLPENERPTVVRATHEGSAIAGLADGRVLFYDATTVTYRRINDDGVPVRTLDPRSDGSLVAVDDAGRMWLLTESGRRLITANADGIEDVRVVDWANQAVTTDRLGSMRLWDLESGRQLALLRPGPGAADAVAIIDEASRRVWVPSGQTLEALSTDPAEWVSLLCQRTTRQLTSAELETHLPTGLRDSLDPEVCT